MRLRLSAQALVHTCGNILVTCKCIVHPRPALTHLPPMRGRFATLTHDRAPRPPSGCHHRHRHRHRHASCYIIMLDKNGPQTLQLSPSSQSSSTCFLRHHRVWQDGPPRPSRMGPHGLGALAPRYYLVLPLGGSGTIRSCWKGVATRHSCGCVVLPHIGHTRKSLLSHSGGWGQHVILTLASQPNRLEPQAACMGCSDHEEMEELQAVAGTFPGSSSYFVKDTATLPVPPAFISAAQLTSPQPEALP
jgi:hypothetical protein